jgi:hypothetical protein
MKTLDYNEARQMIYEIAAHATIFVSVQGEYEMEEKTILGNATVFNPDGSQVGSSKNEWIADRVMEIVKRNGGEFRIYSSYFNWATGSYKLS